MNKKLITLLTLISLIFVTQSDAARRRVYYSEPDYSYNNDEYVEYYDDSGSRAAKGMFGGAASGALLGGIFGGGRGAGIGAGVGAVFGGLTGGLSGRRREVVYQDAYPQESRVIERYDGQDYNNDEYETYD